MKIIDARSGEVCDLGKAIQYGDGEWMRVDDVKPGIFRAEALVTYRYRNPMTGMFVVEVNRKVPLIVRWMHPAFLFQHVAFVPS